MPEISLFFGIRVTMYYKDHNPPHIHVQYGDFKAVIDFQHGTVMEGYLPSRQLKMVLAWCVMYQDELMQCWALASEGKAPGRIPAMTRR